MNHLHESNLPPGVTESMIPGNSRRDIAIQRAWEKVEDGLNAGGVPCWLSDAVLGGRSTDIFTVSRRLNWLYELCDGYAGCSEIVQAIEEARNIAAEASEW